MQEVLTVSELSQAIKFHLESRFPEVAVQGEITNFKEQSSGHLYFSLKDKDAQISAVLFRGNALKLKKIPKNGDRVILKGELSLYVPRGSYQIIVREVTYLGVGELLLKFQALKEKLEKQGYFETNRKKKLPKYPKTIGVVTSKTGAVIQDILNILERRFSGFHLILNPVKVQGEGAALEIAKAIDDFNRYQLCDLLIVGRGGGNLEDLWAFNEECVASAIFRSKIPIISAVGHETDFCIADFVADLRAPTPSAAAEIATAEKNAELVFLKKTKMQITNVLQNLLKIEKNHLLYFLKQPVIRKAAPLLNPKLQALSTLEIDLEDAIVAHLKTKKLELLSVQKTLSALNPSLQIQALKEQLLSFSLRFKTSGRLLLSQHPIPKYTPFDQRISSLIQDKKKRLASLTLHLQSIDPKNLLKKGYCILFEENTASVILSINTLKVGKKVSMQFSDGTALAHIDEVKTHV